MKMRVISSKDEINDISENEEVIHLAFRPSNTDIFTMVKKSPNMKAIHIPPSYKKTISKATQMFLDMQGIALMEGDVWGHRKDINEYSEISQNVYDKIDQYIADGLSDDEIVAKIDREVNMGTDLLRFIIKSRKQ